MAIGMISVWRCCVCVYGSRRYLACGFIDVLSSVSFFRCVGSSSLCFSFSVDEGRSARCLRLFTIINNGVSVGIH